MRAVCLAMLAFLLLSCSTFQSSGLPVLNGLPSAEQSLSGEIVQSCEQTFFKGQYQFVHSIVFQMADGHGATVIGVTVLDGDTLKTGLMGVEGFVFFEAIQKKDSSLEVNRALPPFDDPGFASGLMRDVRTLFQVPSDPHPSVGTFADGTSVCRYVEDKGQTTDVKINMDGSREITVYDTDHNRERSITVGPRIPVDGLLIPGNLKLKAHGMRGYSLDMTLISAEKIRKYENKKI
ncbi:MAG TPA: hypothetical protein EYG88_02545 [Desulfocapsa sulfexigens]|nr:hypothetical protein [Desulfocapsa sulfexigens]